MAAAVASRNVSASGADALVEAIRAFRTADLHAVGIGPLALALVDAIRLEQAPVLRALADRIDELTSALADGSDSTDSEARELELQGQLAGIRAVVHSALERTISDQTIAELAPGSHAHGMLRLIESRSGLSNGELRQRLKVSESEVSRVGRRLASRGLARKRKLGTANCWEITPRGRRALELVRDERSAPRRPAALEDQFSDLATALVGTMLDAAPASAGQKELELQIAATAEDLVKSVEPEAGERETAVEFLESLGSELSDVVSIVDGSVRVLLEAKVDRAAGLAKPFVRGRRNHMPGSARLAREPNGAFVVTVSQGRPAGEWEHLEISPFANVAASGGRRSRR